MNNSISKQPRRFMGFVQGIGKKILSTKCVEKFLETETGWRLGVKYRKILGIEEPKQYTEQTVRKAVPKPEPKAKPTFCPEVEEIIAEGPKLFELRAEIQQKYNTMYIQAVQGKKPKDYDLLNKRIGEITRKLYGKEYSYFNLASAPRMAFEEAINAAVSLRYLENLAKTFDVEPKILKKEVKDILSKNLSACEQLRKTDLARNIKTLLDLLK